MYYGLISRSEAAKNIGVLYAMNGLNTSSTNYKATRPAQILKSETKISRTIDVIENEFINPFGIMDDCEKNKLVNLSSGLHVKENDEEMLNVFIIGEQLANEFKKERLLSKEKLFNDTIHKNKAMKMFSQLLGKKSIKSKDGKTKVVEVNRNILGALNSYSLKTGRAVDYKKALTFPLSPIPLSISNPDGSRRSTTKSVLKDKILRGVEFVAPDAFPKNYIVVDMIALANTMTRIPSTYLEYAKSFIKLIPKNFKSVHVIADSYNNSSSLKQNEQQKRGTAETLHIASLQSKTPSDFRERILRNSQNKTRLIELVYQYIKSNKGDCFSVLNTDEIVLSSENYCLQLTGDNVADIDELKSNQEEADTRLILHANYIMTSIEGVTVTIHSPSGDTDVIVLALVLLHEFRENVYVIDGNGRNRKLLRLADVRLEDEIVQALIGFHSFTGNDYISSFFNKGKKKWYELLDGKVKFQDAMSQLGNTWNLSDDLLNKIQQFVCQIYGSRKEKVNDTRYELFHRKYNNQNKIVDMSSLPPCESVLKLHIMRANYVACLWKKSKIAMIDLPNVIYHGWQPDGQIQWIQDDNIYPQDVEDILFDDKNYDVDDVGDEDGESDDDFV